ncbi:hypothetical protein AK812_SmicGene49087 [Symbiodinium microadriaticum]|uniref:Uncharacterized protein n=1 Tax=Symbiodinium microadriaticum TaxID=2951 RepID=A0A1Q9DNW2_SYMMI|nr:hypothetical protein AK812_SmicGene49087 [Symbiodinium microadriaticum]
MEAELVMTVLLCMLHRTPDKLEHIGIAWRLPYPTVLTEATACEAFHLRPPEHDSSRHHHQLQASVGCGLILPRSCSHLLLRCEDSGIEVMVCKPILEPRGIMLRSMKRTASHALALEALRDKECTCRAKSSPFSTTLSTTPSWPTAHSALPLSVHCSLLTPTACSPRPLLTLLMVLILLRCRRTTSVIGTVAKSATSCTNLRTSQIQEDDPHGHGQRQAAQLAVGLTSYDCMIKENTDVIAFSCCAC